MSSVRAPTEFDSDEDEEITLFPDSAAVVGAPLLPLSSSLESPQTAPPYGNMAPSRNSSEAVTVFAEGAEELAAVSDLSATWRKTDQVFYFGLSVFLFLVLAFALYFVCVYFGVRRARGARTDRFGARWTRLAEG